MSRRSSLPLALPAPLLLTVSILSLADAIRALYPSRAGLAADYDMEALQIHNGWRRLGGRGEGVMRVLDADLSPKLGYSGAATQET